MRILHVVAKKKGFEVNPSVHAQIESLKKILDIDVFVYEASSLVNYLHALYFLHHRIKYQNYDLIHAHFSRSALLSLLACYNKIPVIVSYMGTDLLGKNQLNVWIKRFVTKKVSYQIVKSKEMITYLPPSKSISVIPNGVCFERFHPIKMEEARKQLGLENDIVYFLFPGSPHRKEKNFPLAEKAVNLAQKYLGKKIELLTIYNETHERVNLFMNACDIVLLTSTYEGSPNVIKEALACNCRIVSTNVGDVKERLEGVKGCFLAEPNPEDFAKKTLKGLTACKKTNGREKIKELNIAFIAERIKKLYHSIAMDKNKPS